MRFPTLLVTALLTLCSGTAWSFKVPKNAKNLAQLEDAQKEAAGKSQPLAFVIANKKMVAT